MAELSTNTLFYILIGALALAIVAILFLNWREGAINMIKGITTIMPA